MLPSLVNQVIGGLTLAIGLGLGEQPYLVVQDDVVRLISGLHMLLLFSPGCCLLAVLHLRARPGGARCPGDGSQPWGDHHGRVHRPQGRGQEGHQLQGQDPGHTQEHPPPLLPPGPHLVPGPPPRHPARAVASGRLQLLPGLLHSGLQRPGQPSYPGTGQGPDHGGGQHIHAHQDREDGEEK